MKNLDTYLEMSLLEEDKYLMEMASIGDIIYERINQTIIGEMVLSS